MNFIFKLIIIVGIITLVSNTILAEEGETNFLSGYLNSENGILLAENIKLNLAELFKDLLKIADDEETIIACSEEENLKDCIGERSTEKGIKQQEQRLGMIQRGIQSLQNFGALEGNDFIQDLN
jgi:hypothetical protein